LNDPSSIGAVAGIRQWQSLVKIKAKTDAQTYNSTLNSEDKCWKAAGVDV